MNIHYFNRYKNFIQLCSKLQRISDSGIYEHHHILPIALGGDNSHSNIIRLTPREHYIAHWMLAYVYGGPMWHAFWMMNTDLRNKHYRYKNSYGYELARINQKRIISEKMANHLTAFDKVLNKFVHISTKEFHNNSDRYIHPSAGKSNYYYNGKIINMKTDDPRVINGEAVHIRTNYHHQKETIEKMKLHSIHGKIAITNKITNKIQYIDENDNIPAGWIKGYTSKLCEQLSNRNKKIFSTCKWITNGIDNKRIVIYNEVDIPEGWHIGRTLKQRKCEYCGKIVDIGNYAQYHGKHCKYFKGDAK